VSSEAQKIAWEMSLGAETLLAIFLWRRNDYLAWLIRLQVISELVAWWIGARHVAGSNAYEYYWRANQAAVLVGRAGLALQFRAHVRMIVAFGTGMGLLASLVLFQPVVWPYSYQEWWFRSSAAIYCALAVYCSGFAGFRAVMCVWFTLMAMSFSAAAWSISTAGILMNIVCGVTYLAFLRYNRGK
jgi:hypothetical protein